MNVTVQINIRFQLLNNSIAVLHKFIGPNYMELGHQPRNRQPGAPGHFPIHGAGGLYVPRSNPGKNPRECRAEGLGANLNKLVQPEAMEQPDPKNYNDFLQYSIQILDTLVLSIELPPAIVGAINRQTEQFYLIQEYRYRVEREAEESKRKQIEANGIAAFQKTVSQGISDSYLRWRGIEATLALAQSHEFEDRGDRQRQGRSAHHPRQCRYPCFAGAAGSAAIGTDRSARWQHIAAARHRDDGS